MRLTPALTAVLLLATAGVAGAQQRERAPDRDRQRVIVRTPGGEGWSIGGDEDRAFLGVSTGTTGKRDTLGLLVTGITAGGPAEKAGIEEGNRIAAINGVNLRLSREDAGEGDMEGIASRRLTRELGKVKAGDEVTLRVWGDGRYRDVKVKTTSREEMPGMMRFGREESESRPTVGLSLESTGSARDSLGIFVSRVEPGGPAEKAGIIEGDRIAAINGVSLRLASEDAGDAWIANAKAGRFTRELRKAKVGDEVELRVWKDGQMRTIRVKTAAASDVYKNRRDVRIRVGDGIGFAPMAPMPPMPPMAPMTPMTPGTPRAFTLPRGQLWLDEDMDAEEIERTVQRALEAAERARASAVQSRVRSTQQRLRLDDARRRATEAELRATRAASWNM